MKPKKRWVTLLCAGLLLSQPALAEEKAEKEGYESYSLGEVYVTGEKTPVTKETSIHNVVTAEDIKATNSKTVAEALSFVPGMRVTTGMKNEPFVSIHGVFDQSRILVLIDGVPYYETKSGKLDLNQFPVDNVAKIEITKGGASVLYGANAMGGVINIVTKTPVGKPTFGVNVEGGQVDYFKTSASHGMNTGLFNYWINYEHSQAHGWPMSDSFRQRWGKAVQGNRTLFWGIFEDGGTRNQSDYRSDSIWAKFGVTPTKDADYSINFHYIDRNKGNPPSLDQVTVFTSPPAFSQFFRFPTYNDWGIDLSGQQKIGDMLTLKAKAFYHNHVDELESFANQAYAREIAQSRYQDYIVGGSLIAELKPVEWDTLRFSFNYKGDSHKQRDDAYLPYENFFSWTGSAGIENEVNIGKSFSFVLGGSYDWFKVSEASKNNTAANGLLINQTPVYTKPMISSFNPMFGAEYKFPDTTKLYTSVAYKTRFPTLNSLFAGASSGGNPNLLPETALNITLGASRSFGTLAFGELAFFYHDISNLITRSGPNRTDPYMNVGKVRVFGFEANTEFYPVKDMVLRLAYNYNNATDLSAGRKTDNVLYVPEHKLDMSARYTIPYIVTRIDLNGILFSDTYRQLPSPSRPTDPTLKAGGYFVLNTRLSKMFLKNFEAYLAINNIFDREYEPEIGFPAAGRTFFGGVTAKF